MNLGRIFAALGNGFRALAHLAGYWKIIVLAAYFLSGVGPHIRWAYEYRAGYDGYRAYISCTYLGPKGIVTPDLIDNCPVLIWLDANPWVIL